MTSSEAGRRRCWTAPRSARTALESTLSATPCAVPGAAEEGNECAGSVGCLWKRQKRRILFGVARPVPRAHVARPAMETLKYPTAAAVGLALVAVLAAFLIPKLVRPPNGPLGWTCPAADGPAQRPFVRRPRRIARAPAQPQRRGAVCQAGRAAAAAGRPRLHAGEAAAVRRQGRDQAGLRRHQGRRL